jgi:hypothetical protein
MIRGILSVLAGLAVAFVIVMATEMVNLLIFPFPQGVDMNDRAALEALLASAPVHKLVLVPIGWFLGTLVGGLVAGKIGRSPVPALIVGGLLLLVGIANLWMIKHPAWFWPVGMGAFVAGTALATPLVRRST